MFVSISEEERILQEILQQAKLECKACGRKARIEKTEESSVSDAPGLLVIKKEYLELNNLRQFQDCTCTMDLMPSTVVNGNEQYQYMQNSSTL